MSGNSVSQYFYRLYLLSFPDYLSTCPLSISSSEKFWENMNIGWVLENIFWNTCWTLWKFWEHSEIFWNYFVELFRIFSQDLLKTSKNVRKVNFGLILGKLWRNTVVTWNYQFCGCYGEYWKYFFQVLVKLWRNFEEKWGILCTNFYTF